MANKASVWWRGRRVGITNIDDIYGNEVHVPDEITIQEIAHAKITFDRDFAELYGLTGVELEPAPD